MRAKTRRRRGSPTPDTPAAGWEAQETPDPRRNRPAPSPRPQLPSRAGHRAPIPERAEGSLGCQGRGYLEARGCNPSGCPRAQGLPEAGASALPGVRGVRSWERSRPGGRSSGARGDGSGHGESRAEAETLPGALDWGWGGGGYGAGVGGRLPCRRSAPACQGPITSRRRVLSLTPAPLSLIDPGKGES